MRFSRDGFSVEVLLERGAPLPEWYEAEPELGPFEDFYLGAFWALSTERPVGWSIGPIPHRRVVEYGREHGLEPDVLESFVEVVRSMDSAFLKWHEEESKKNRANGGSAGAGAGKPKRKSKRKAQ